MHFASTPSPAGQPRVQHRTAWALMAACLFLTPGPRSPSRSAPPVQWTRIFAGWGTATGFEIQQTSDGGYIAVGRTHSGDSGYAAFLVKLDPAGYTQRTRAIRADHGMSGLSVVQTSDGGYIVAGTTSEACLIKTDSSGNEIWRSRRASEISANAQSVLSLSDTAYTAVVRSGLGDSAVTLWSTDNVGNLRWSGKYIHYDYGTLDEHLSLRRTSDGGYIIGTKTLLKVDSLGLQPSLRTFGSVMSANSVIQTSDGGYAATGAKLGYSSIYLLRTNANRDSVWMRTYVPTECSRGHWVEQTTDGGYIIAGTTRPVVGDEVTLVRTQPDGTLDWTVTLFDGDGYCVRQAADGGYIVCGRSWSYGPNGAGAARLFVTKLAPDRTR
jgi:hypothetical protein